MASNAEISSALSGLDFPATKGDMLKYARMNKRAQKVLGIDGFEHVIQALNQLPDGRFETISDVWSEAGQKAA